MSAVQSYIEDLLACSGPASAADGDGTDLATPDDCGPRVWEDAAAELVLVSVAVGRVAVRADAVAEPTPASPAHCDGQRIMLTMGGATLELSASPTAPATSTSYAVGLGLSGTCWWLHAEEVVPLGRIGRAEVRWRRRRETDPAVIGLVGAERLPLVDVPLLAGMLSGR